MVENRNLELYLHIPFCKKKCAYCDFLSFQASENQIAEYVEALEAEIGQEDEAGTVTTIFFGGGTPSILSGEHILRLMDAVKKKYEISPDAEVTLEANPGTLDQEKLKAYRMAGINRLSLGLQSAQNGELKVLGRIHTWEEFQESYQLAREAGFQNINVDLMSALPGQKADTWRDTLLKVVRLMPEHISAYSLIIEEGTPFFEKYRDEVRSRERGEDCHLLPSEEEERRMYYDTGKILEGAGYRRYEISNYAKEGYECRHNCGYWQRKEYLGFGLGASSLMGETRYHNTESMECYLRRNFLKEDREKLSIQAQMEEFMFLGLRLCEGVSIRKFEEKFSVSLAKIYGKVIQEFQEKGLLKQNAGFLVLTEKGIDVSNYVLSEFLL